MSTKVFDRLRKVLIVSIIVALVVALASLCTMVSATGENEGGETSPSSTQSTASVPSTPAPVSQPETTSSQGSTTSQTVSNSVTSSKNSTSSKKVTSSKKATVSSKKSTTSKKTYSNNNTYTYTKPKKNQDKIEHIDAFDDSKVTQDEHDKVVEEGKEGKIVTGVRNKYYTYGRYGVIAGSAAAVCLAIGLVFTNIIYNKKYRPFDDVAKMKREKRKAKKAKKQKAKKTGKKVQKSVKRKR